ncbi:right-handed parallel beta-helix repeat-containing protein [Candidatus Micrarchaeota archaeon]|nr:right-handed parallel beta-helix repeat-containing protein [Candidatus Micrarchaeota archaeon]
MKTILFILLFTIATFAYNVSNCTDLDQPGFYYLTNDLVGAQGNHACIRIFNDNITFSCNSFSITGEPSNKYGVEISADNVTVENCTIVDYQRSFYVLSSSNVTLTNNSMLNSDYGIVIYNSHDIILTNNFINGNSKHGVLISSSNNIYVVNNTASENNQYGVYIASGYKNSIINNVVNGNGLINVYLKDSSNNSLINNTVYDSKYGVNTNSNSNENLLLGNVIYNNTKYSIAISSMNNTIEKNLLYNNGFGGLILSANATYNHFIENQVYDNTNYGVYLYHASENILLNNMVYNNSKYNFVLYSSTNNLLLNNTATGAPDSGFYVSVSSTNNIANNSVYNNSYGFRLTTGNENTISGNTISENNIGFQIVKSENNTIINNTISNNFEYGIYLTTNSASNSFVDNIIYGSLIGIRIQDSNANNLNHNTFHGNPGFGIFLLNSDETNISATHLYNNTYSDFNVRATVPISFILSNITIDNPLGTLENYTTISITDSMIPTSRYGISWWNNESIDLPSDTKSFAGKFILLHTTVGDVSIDSISFGWFDSETLGYNEDNFMLYTNDSEWVRLNASLDTANDLLTLTNLSIFNAIGILENITSGTNTTNTTNTTNSTNTSESLIYGCVELTAPGDYFLTNDLYGSNISVSLGNNIESACIVISSSGVSLDCNISGLSANNSVNSAAILVNGSSTGIGNVTINNCRVSDYTYGIYFLNAENSTISDTTISNSPNSLFLNGSVNNLINDLNLTVPENGTYMYSSDPNNFTDLTICNIGTLSCVRWPVLNLLTADISNNNSNFDNNFIFINSSAFNGSSTMTMQTDSCENQLFWSPVIPASETELSNLEIHSSTCTENGSMSFTLNWTSGYYTLLLPEPEVPPPTPPDDDNDNHRRTRDQEEGEVTSEEPSVEPVIETEETVQVTFPEVIEEQVIEPVMPQVREFRTSGISFDSQNDRLAEDRASFYATSGQMVATSQYQPEPIPTLNIFDMFINNLISLSTWFRSLVSEFLGI